MSNCPSKATPITLDDQFPNNSLLHQKQLFSVIVRPERSIETIPSFDQWSLTIENHWNQWSDNPKTIDFNGQSTKKTFNGVSCLLNHCNGLTKTIEIAKLSHPASIGWVALSSLVFRSSSFVRPASVTSPLISTIWCSRPYKPYIFC